MMNNIEVSTAVVPLALLIDVHNLMVSIDDGLSDEVTSIKLRIADLLTQYKVF